MDETEREKRRFVVISDQDVAGVVCEDFGITIQGISFYNCRPGPVYGFQVLHVAPTNLAAFFELTTGEDWPAGVGMIYSEGRRRLTNADTD